MIDKLGWKKGSEFDLLVTVTDVAKSRPCPIYDLICNGAICIADAKEVIKVGDPIIDIEEGRNAGCSLNIGITTGAHTYDRLGSANQEYIINNLVELLPLLN